MPEKRNVIDPEQFRKIRAAFEGALEIPEGSERDRYLDQAAGDDLPLLADVRRLLRQHERVNESISSGGLPRFGPYQAKRVVGRGGEGVVWEAERADGEFDRKVAVKVLAPGSLGADSQQRLRAERQILAALVHPGIAQLFDGGVTEDGVPYLVAEFVEGEHLDVYCDRRGLSPKDRLRLLAQIFDAVQYAHDRGVVHRDLKPSNMLVTAEGQTKLVDFGTASLREVDANRLQPGLTPEYASPEMLAGERGDKLSDIFALGVIYRKILSSAARQRVVRKATATQPADRYQSIRGLREAVYSRRWPLPTALGLSVVAVCVGLAWWIAHRPPHLRAITPEGESWRDAAVSRDGRSIAYVTSGARFEYELWVREVDKPPDRLLRDRHPISDPTVAPGGRFVAFYSDESPAGIREWDRQSGARRMLVQGGHVPKYSPDGQWLLYATADDRDDVQRSRPGVWHVAPARGGTPRPVGGDVSMVTWAYWESSDAILFQGARPPASYPRQVWRYSLKSGQLELVTRWGQGWLTICGLLPGKPLTAVATEAFDSGLFEIPLSSAEFVPRVIARLDGLWGCSVDAQGVIYLRKHRLATQLHQLAFDGTLSTWQPPPGESAGEAWNSKTVSRSGARVMLYDRVAKTIVVDRGTGSVAGRVVGRGSHSAALSGDGEVLWVHEFKRDLTQRLSVSLNPTVLEDLPVSIGISAIDRDGKRAIGPGLTLEARRSMALHTAGESLVTILRHPTRAVYRGTFSFDERWLAFTTLDAKRGLLVQIAPFRGAQPVSPEEWVEVGEGTAAAFHPSGNRLYFVSRREGAWCLYAVDLDPESKKPMGESWAVAHFHGAFTPEQMAGSTFELQSSEAGLYFTLGRQEQRLFRLE